MNSPRTFEPLLDAKAVAHFLGLHRQTVLKFARSGRLKSVLYGRVRRFRRRDVEAWIEAHMSHSRQQESVA